MSKRKLLVYLASDFHARSFFSGNLVDALITHFDLIIAATTDIQSLKEPNQVRIIRINKKPEKLFYKYLDASLIKNRKKSSSFRFRLHRYVFGDYPKWIGFSPRGLVRLLKAMLFSTPYVYETLCKIYRNSVMADSQILKIVIEHKVDLIICWSQSMEPAALESVLAARKASIQSMLVYDNWDNLSSKTVILERPDFVVCFGERSKRFAVELHGVAPFSVFALGSARFDVYVDQPRRDYVSRREVLIIGSSIALEDKAILNLVANWINRQSMNSNFLDYKFSYRPHPAPQGLSINLRNWQYPEIQVDRFSIENDFSSKGIWQDQQSLASSLASKKLVIAAPTTLLLEALLSGCKVLVPALPVKGINTSISKMLSNLEHLKDLKTLPNLVIVNDNQEFWKEIDECLSAQTTLEAISNLGEEVTTEPGTFASRFINVIMNIFEMKHDKW